MHFLTRKINWEETAEIHRPDLLCEDLCKTTYGHQPLTRLLNESGRESPMPIFVVGVFARTLKVGEGFGQSISMARHNAFLNAILMHQLAPKPHAVAAGKIE